MEGTLVSDPYSGYTLKTKLIPSLIVLLWKPELLYNTWSEQAGGTGSILTALRKEEN